MGVVNHVPALAMTDSDGSHNESEGGGGRCVIVSTKCLLKFRDMAGKFGTFVGPGFMIAVAYIDPGNYSTDVAAGATYRFKLLFIVSISNVFAVFLQSLCIKFGSVSGFNLAKACKEFLPKWLNIALYIMTEVAVSFEMFVIALVMGVVVCFCVQLSLIKDTSAKELFRGFLPSSAIVQSQGLYQAYGIPSATIMPHNLYLGSGIVQAHLQEYDVKAGLAPATTSSNSEEQKYYLSLSAIKFCLKYSIAKLSITLFTFALFVNNAILIVVSASLSIINFVTNANLFGIYDLLSSSLAPATRTIFALTLLLSGH
ncbi:Nramp-domain-containing protein [Acephala macrosclerotiorum]|nr:Nramp-domain-containing protein [Acephala macrosclerotiorum]